MTIGVPGRERQGTTSQGHSLDHLVSDLDMIAKNGHDCQEITKDKEEQPFRHISVKN